MRRRFYEILEAAAEGDTISRIWDVSISTLIILNIVAMIAETVDPLGTLGQTFFYVFELISVLIFTVEYILRLWSCTENTAYAHPILGRFRFAVTPLLVVDLLAFLPFYLIFLPIDSRFIRVLRLLRMLRIAKLGRYSSALQTLNRVLSKKKEQLIITISFMFILIILASSLMYFAEHAAQPDAFSSIPEAMWWSIATLTTVGYGDVYPVTAIGKILGSVVAVLGVALFALPTGILGAGFVEEIQRKESPTIVCPYCGKEYKPDTRDDEN